MCIGSFSLGLYLEHNGELIMEKNHMTVILPIMLIYGFVINDELIPNEMYIVTVTLLPCFTDQTFVNLTSQREKVTVTEHINETADFIVVYHSYPKPNITWKKDNENITKKHTNIETGFL